MVHKIGKEMKNGNGKHLSFVWHHYFRPHLRGVANTEADHKPKRKDRQSCKMVS